jgi:hypothetical protein
MPELGGVLRQCSRYETLVRRGPDVALWQWCYLAIKCGPEQIELPLFQACGSTGVPRDRKPNKIPLRRTATRSSSLAARCLGKSTAWCYRAGHWQPCYPTMPPHPPLYRPHCWFPQSEGCLRIFTQSNFGNWASCFLSLDVDVEKTPAGRPYVECLVEPCSGTTPWRVANLILIHTARAFRLLTITRVRPL